MAADRRHKPAGVLSGGERRLRNLSRFGYGTDVLLVDEPSIKSRASLIWSLKF